MTTEHSTEFDTSTALTSPTKPPRISLDQAMQLALKHQQQGRLAEAEALLRNILQAQPQHPHALHLLGVIAHQAGKAELAIQLISQAIASSPSVAQYYANRGEMYRQQGQVEAAIADGEKAIALDPLSVQAHSNLGIAYYDRKDYEKAEACQHNALALAPDHPQALNNLGSILRQRKDLKGAQAVYAKVLAANPDFLETLNNLGATLTEDERPEEAIPYLLKAVRLNPKYAEAHCNLGVTFLSMEDLDRAFTGYTHALKLREDYPEAWQGLAKVHQERKQLSEAQAAAQRSLELAPERPEIHCLLGSLYAEAGFPERAEAAYAQALALDPDSVSAYLGKGHLLMEQGKLEAAEECFLHALSLKPDELSARMAITQVRKTRADDDNMAALIERAKDLDTLSEMRAIPLHFALGKCYDDIGDYDRAFPHFLEGTRLKRQRIQYSADNNEKAIDNITRMFDRAAIDRLRGGGNPDPTPIFVLGMPRSGTTLTEQILASHPQVYGAGELPDLLQIVNRPHGEDTEGYPLSLKNITQVELTMMGSRYIEGLRRRSADAPRITDKMPANFYAVGLIHLMLPNAKIIHVNRNPVDTCLSAFMRLFNRSQHQSYDLSEIGRYYRDYARLMAHWRAVLPANAFLDVHYEELVADNETQARRLLDFCDLPWDDSCLDFHKTERSVRTASVTQVRQPIYKSSVERWRKYEKHLGPLLEALGDLVPSA